MELCAHIKTLESEAYFLREELKDKSILLKSLIAAKGNANKSLSLPTTPEQLRHRMQLVKSNITIK